ncbi:MAG: UDP-glucose 4-epimerase GalE [Eubacterium sp.]|jgi:UDP-glucose 4-epimerase|nr:UDP-glucose 4-epimerase GalE [Eubacterium sp.]
MAVLVTGGAGYIGSHTCVELLARGEQIIVADNFYNSKPRVIDMVKEITGKDFKFYKADICDRSSVENIFRENDIEAVIHFAGYKAVGESVKEPLMYYKNNIYSSVILLETMKKSRCKQFVFSSSATVYGIPKSVPITEDFPLGSINPYGSTKLIVENICRDLYDSEPDFRIALLRYFNPIGAHESGKIGDDPNGVPNNLMPIIMRVASGKLDKLSVYGNDYPTPDGTGIRDYLHVTDLALGHVRAIEKVRKEVGCKAFNLGTGKGYSVLEIINAFEEVNGLKIPDFIAPRRHGDAAECYSDPSLAKNELNWETKIGLNEMCRSSWNFAKSQIN